MGSSFSPRSLTPIKCNLKALSRKINQKLLNKMALVIQGYCRRLPLYHKITKDFNKIILRMCLIIKILNKKKLKVR
jgi:hypothetical protein